MSKDDLAAGMEALRAGRWDEGIARLQSALALEPRLAEAWSNLGYALRERGRIPEARDALHRAIALKPKLADAWNLLGLVEQQSSQHAEAWRDFDRAIDLRPDFAVAWMNRANSDQALGRLEAALAGYARALELAPANAAIHYNLGHLHQKVTGRLDEAIQRYREAIRLDPNLADAHLNLSHVLFLTGRFDEGWREFAWRPQRRAFAAYEVPASNPWPERLDIVGEQGLGDMLFFLRWASPAAERGTRLTFSGDPRLHPMLARTRLFSELFGEAGRAPKAPEILVGDLPLLFADSSLQFPPSLKLQEDEHARERLAQRLEAAGPRPWIALTWRAGERSTGLFDRLFKEVPLDALGKALRGGRATWLSMQRAPAEDERERLEGAIGAKIHDFSDANADLEMALAAMDLVDDYVTVSNTNVHLRAGLDKPARVLVPFAPEWRWGTEGPSRWFPRMTTYRQAPGGDWSRALADLASMMRRNDSSRSSRS